MNQLPLDDTPLRKNKTKKRSLIILSISLMMILLITLSGVLLFFNLPTFQQVRLNQTDDIQIYFAGVRTSFQAVDINDQLYIPFELVKEYIDKSVEWDEASSQAIIATDKEVYHFPLGKRDGLLNLEPYSFTYPLIEENGLIYMPLEPINSFYNIAANYFKDNSLLIINNLSAPVQKGVVIKEAKIREASTIFSPWFNEVGLEQDIIIIKEVNGWYLIEADNGLMGYIEKRKVQLTEIIINDIVKEVYQPWNPIGKPVILTWEHVNRNNPDTNKIGDLSSLQVVSPTWFHLQSEGLVTNNADINYVNWAHQRNYQVWGLFSNSFDLDITHEMLNDVNLRIKVIKQLLSYVDLYKLDGINLDFENVYLKDKQALVQFIRELTPLMHEKDRTVSIDVTFASGSENWSMFYDRKSIGEIVDYMIVMGYDEHWSASPTSGSVASLPWVENGLKNLLKEVPSEKVILGVPFYTRQWIETKDDYGNIKVSSKTFSMAQTKKWIQDNNLTIQYDKKSGQNYAELSEGNIIYKVWIEDDLSIQKRINLMKEYRLAGLAAWRRGFESTDFWSIISKAIDERP